MTRTSRDSRDNNDEEEALRVNDDNDTDSLSLSGDFRSSK